MSTLHVSTQTHRRVLLQPAALEDVVADNLKGTDETGHIEFVYANEAGVQHGRGEIARTPVRVSQRHPQAQAEGVMGREPYAQPCVFVLSKDGKPLDPTSPRRARLLLKTGRAVVVKATPFVIRVKDRHSRDSTTQSVVTGVDPGSKTTGFAVWRETTPGVRECVFLAEVGHRGAVTSKKLEQRSNYRRRRRSANLRYRPARFSNRTKPDKRGNPCLKYTRQKTHYGYQTGDYVRAVVPAGKHAGVHVGRVAVRKSGSFVVTGADGVRRDINHQHCTLLQRQDGYGYQRGENT
jgi:hypothetical protein